MGLLLFKGSNNEFQDNFYMDINKEIITGYKLKDGEYTYSTFSKAQDIVDDNTNNIVNDIIDGNRVLSKGNSSNIKYIYNKIIDSNKREENGIKDLKYYIDRVFNVSSVDELMDVIILVENELGIDLISNIEVMPDYKDNSHNIIYFMPVTYAFGASSDYIVNDDYMAYKAYLKRASIRLWMEYGLDKKNARKIVGELFNFYASIAKYSKGNNELTDIESLYNVVDKDKLLSFYSLEYLSKRGIDKYNSYSVVDEKQIKVLIDSLNDNNIEIWKYVINTKILSSYAMYGSDSYRNIVIDLNNAILGSNDDDNINVDMVKNIFSEEIDSVYEELYKDKDISDDINDIFKEIKNTYRDMLLNNDWLSNSTRDMAIKKLDSMKLIIGSDSEVDSYFISNDIRVSDDSLIKDIINIKRLSNSKDLEKLDNNGKLDIISQIQVNAYYQPIDNSIVVPIAMFSLIDSNSNYYEKLGTIGMIIAHEVTHSFDSNGSKFDEVGNLNNWWSDEDRSLFLKKKQRVVDYYSKYEVLNGKYINGERTVDENIADLGAVNCITKILEKRKATNKEYKEMYKSFASLWSSVDSDDYMELLLLQDTHSPNQYRVNAVMSSIDKFYEVYKIKPWNKMWISKNERVSVW